jgi:class I fructose-bisphosphate aldolase
MTMPSKIVDLLGDKAEYLLYHQCKTIAKENLHTPSPDCIEKIWINSNRNNQVLRNFQGLLSHGRLSGTGYCSILPVDQGIEHSAGSAFAINPIYFDPENIVKLAVEGGCNAVVCTF